MAPLGAGARDKCPTRPTPRYATARVDGKRVHNDEVIWKWKMFYVIIINCACWKRNGYGFVQQQTTPVTPRRDETLLWPP